MLMRSFGKTFSVPMNDKQLQSQQIQQVISELIQQQQNFINEKLQKNQMMGSRIKKIQEDFSEWADKKYQKFKMKLQKSEKNKNEILEKKVKKYQDKDKMHHQKIKNVLSKRKQDLRQAWRAANKFNQKILSTKNFHGTKLQKKSQNHIHQQQDQTRSIMITDNQADEVNEFRKTSKSQFINKSLHRSQQKALGSQVKKLFDVNKKYSLNRKEQEKTINNVDQTQEQSNPELTYNDKLKMNLLRHRMYTSQQENKKIQQLGKRLKKIQLYRIKKQSLNKSKYKKSPTKSLSGSRERLDTQKKEKKKQKLKSEPIDCDQIKRASKWSQSNKIRRQQLFLSHLHSGNTYLEQNKIRYLKEILCKNSSFNAIQKKLYMERLKH